MDPVSAQSVSSPPIPQSSFFKGKLKFLIGIVFLLLLASVVAVVIFQSKRQLKEKAATQNAAVQTQTVEIPTKERGVVKVSELPIGVDLLKNPIIDQWRGSFDKATLISKNEVSITIEKDGSRLVIPVDPKFTLFYSNDKAKKGAKIGSKDIPIGGTVRGDFFAIPSKDDKNKIVGGAITYQEKPE